MTDQPTDHRAEADLRQWAAEEQDRLWHDLDHNIRHAINGRWSIAAADSALRIGKVARLIGPSRYGDIPWTLLAGGVYEAVLDVVGVQPDLPDAAEWERLDQVMESHGGPRAQLQRQHAATIAAIQSPRESAYIRDEDEA